MHLVDTVGDDAHGIDIQSGVGLVEDAELRFEHGHLEDLVALLLATGESLVDGSVGEFRIEFYDLALLAHEFHEVGSLQRLLALIRALGVDGRLHEVGHAHARNLHGVLEREK